MFASLCCTFEIDDWKKKRKKFSLRNESCLLLCSMQIQHIFLYLHRPIFIRLLFGFDAVQMHLFGVIVIAHQKWYSFIEICINAISATDLEMIKVGALFLSLPFFFYYFAAYFICFQLTIAISIIASIFIIIVKII